MVGTHITRIGLALVAVFAMSAVVASAASATLPEMSPTSGAFIGSSGESVFETKSGEKVKCSEDSVTGEITGAKTSRSTITFKGCAAFGFECNSPGAGPGEIIYKVNGELVYIMKATKEVGVINTLTAELTIKCSAFQTFKIKGSTLCKLTPVNTKTVKFTLLCKQTKGVQEPVNYEPGSELIKAPITETKGEGLKNFAFEQSGLGTTEGLTLSTEGEVKA